ncbi:MAG: hypothetical protein HY717_24300 [Planctomycetes bacterium]|nr:hypothetical protein [Planctomycetota bacterium]
MVLIGYFPKETATPQGLYVPPTVKEICSVSDCLTKGPSGWIDRWKHNDLGFYNTPEIAKEIAGADASRFSIFAYRLLPKRFTHGAIEPMEIPSLAVSPLPTGWVSLGFDVVSKSISLFFECSPLSCNGMCDEVEVQSKLKKRHHELEVDEEIIKALRKKARKLGISVTRLANQILRGQISKVA